MIREILWDSSARAVRPYMQEATPNEVAKAVSTVMMNWMSLPQMGDLLVSIGLD